MTPSEKLASRFGEGLGDDGCWITPDGTIISVPHCGHTEVDSRWRDYIREANGDLETSYKNCLLALGGIRISTNCDADVTIEWRAPTKDALHAFRRLLKELEEYDHSGEGACFEAPEAAGGYDFCADWRDVSRAVSACLSRIREEARAEKLLAAAGG